MAPAAAPRTVAGLRLTVVAAEPRARAGRPQPGGVTPPMAHSAHPGRGECMHEEDGQVPQSVVTRAAALATASNLRLPCAPSSASTPGSTSASNEEPHWNTFSLASNKYGVFPTWGHGPDAEGGGSGEGVVDGGEEAEEDSGRASAIGFGVAELLSPARRGPGKGIGSSRGTCDVSSQ